MSAPKPLPLFAWAQAYSPDSVSPAFDAIFAQQYFCCKPFTNNTAIED
jgi:hypothetical protein